MRMLTTLLLLTMTAPASFAAEPAFSSVVTQRLVHVGTGDAKDFALLDFAVNSTLGARRSKQIRLGRVTKVAASAGGPIEVADPYLAVIDLAWFARDARELQEVLNAYEKLALDEPHFLGKVVRNPDGKTITRLPGSVDVAILQKRHVTQVPLVEFRWFLKKALSRLDGGIYADLIGLPATENEVLKKFCNSNIQRVLAGRSSANALQLVSGVTGKDRKIIVQHTEGGNTEVNQGVFSVTFDRKDANTKARSNQIRTADGGEDDAREYIIELPNGMLISFISDGKGNGQNSAPDDVVVDHRVPAPFTKRLDGGWISCGRCHAKASGWQVVSNDVLDFKKGIYGDLKEPDIEKSLGKLANTLEKPLARARDDYSDACVFLTSHYGVDMDAAAINEYMGTVWAEYNYALIDEAKALHELSSITRRQFAKDATLESLLIPNGADATGFEPEDPIIIALESKKQINRQQFESVFPDLVRRLRP